MYIKMICKNRSQRCEGRHRDSVHGVLLLTGLAWIGIWETTLEIPTIRRCEHPHAHPPVVEIYCLKFNNRASVGLFFTPLLAWKLIGLFHRLGRMEIVKYHPLWCEKVRKFPCI